jgi:hypothetical protein
MNHMCAACRRTAATTGSARALCASCSWLVARTQSQPTAAVRVPTATVSPDAQHDATRWDATDDVDLIMLFELASLVGEDGPDIVRRVLWAFAKGNERAYRAEVNRLTAKFIATLEPLC